jgi:DNA-directed RNA polymerase specialized sigma24 family protein
MQHPEGLDQISRKLDVIIGLLLKARPRPGSEKEDIISLKAAGLSVEEVARALGKTPNSVYLTLSRTRRRPT